MDLLCSICDGPVRDVSELYLPLVRETHRGHWTAAVYLCARRCRAAWLLVEDDLERVERRWLEELA